MKKENHFNPELLIIILDILIYALQAQERSHVEI